MKRKRDPIEEILRKRRRLGRRGSPLALAEERAFAFAFATFELQQISRSGELSGGHLKAEFLRAMPIGLVACLEGYYRLVIRDLIDSGSPYRDRVVKLEEVKLDLHTVVRMQEQKVTTGEFISHLLRLSTIEDINRHMSVLLDMDYFAALKSVTSSRALTEKAFDQIKATAWPTLEGMFDDRNVACHELKSPKGLTYKRLMHQWRAVLFMLDCDDRLREPTANEG